MLGLTGVVVALVALTVILAGVFFVRPSITEGVTGKILAFLGLCVLPVLCIGTGMSFHMARSQQTAYCVSCHSMESHGKSLYIADASYIPAQHFQNHLVPPDQACYTCHTDYTMYGPLKDKIKGLKYLYMEYVSTPPNPIHLLGTYSNLQCLHCHAGMRSFGENPIHTAIMGSLKTNQVSCISCHNKIHNAANVDHLKLWVEGDAPIPTPQGTEPATPVSGAASAPSKGASGSSAAKAATAGGKAIYDAQSCGACHGEAGGGGSAPALTHTSTRYSPAKLTAVLKEPTPGMKSAGMVALSLNAADMNALVSYVIGLGPTAPPARASTSAAGSSAAAPAKAKPVVATAPSKAPDESSADKVKAPGGKAIYNSQGCAGCHGAAGGGGSAPALTHTSNQYPPAKLTAVLRVPTAGMKAGGMVPLTLSAADMEALVSYVTSLGAPAAPSETTSPAVGSSSSAPIKAEPNTIVAGSKATTGGSTGGPSGARGKDLYHSHGCAACHGETGAGGTGPDAGTPLTHISSQYSPAQLTTILKAPTSGMKAASMIPVILSAADMDALVSYVISLGGTAAPTARTPASSSAAPASAEVATTGASKSPDRGSAAKNSATGKAIYDSQGCAGCHGEAGGGGSAPALTHTSSQYPADKLTAVLKAPTAGMAAGGMVPLTLNAADMEALVAYVTSLGGATASSAWAAPASGASSPSSGGAKPASKKKGILSWLFSP